MNIREIIIHCSATPEGRAYTLKDIDRWHRQRGFSSCGYHFVIRLDGTIEKGRPLTDIGAHCQGHNAFSVGVCYIGGVSNDGRLTPKDTRTPQQKEALIRLLRQLKTQYPHATIHSHSDFAPKACPSFDATTEYSNL